MAAHHHHIEHQDVIRIIGISENSFDEAVENGISSIKEGHKSRKDLDFFSFEVVRLQGTIKDGATEEPKVAQYQAIIDVVGRHEHHDHDHDH